MTLDRQQFLSPHRTWRRMHKVYVVLFFAIVFEACYMNVLSDRPDVRVTYWISALLILAAVIIYKTLSSLSARRLGLSCRNCGKALVSISAEITIATGKCGKCGF